MKCVFRADASLEIGTGHIMRCLTLAAALEKHGADIQFITREHSGHLGDMLVRNGFAVTLLPSPEVQMLNEEGYSTWLGVSQQEDAEQSILAMQNQPVDWVIVDHYGLDHIWEVRLKSYTHRLMVIDDLANRSHVCDVLLDQNYAISREDRYRPLVPEYCKFLLGPQYALLRPEYVHYRDTMVPRTGNIERVLVFMGGSDNSNVTSKVLAALSTDQLGYLEVDVVIGANFIHKISVSKQAENRPNTQIHGPCPHLANLMANADLAIGAGGATTWERLCMGLPSLVISIADNQIQSCEALASCGLIQYLGNSHDLDVAKIESALNNALSMSRSLQELATVNQTMVDGLGASRVAEVLKPTKSENLTLRLANERDALFYFSWVNDPIVRSSANNSEPIDMSTHLRWFDDRMKDVDSFLYVLEAGDLPVGQVRFERRDGKVTIDYSLDVLVRGRGWAKQLLKLGMEMFGKEQSIIFNASVKPENLASAATFVGLGFIEQKSDKPDCNLHYQLSVLAPQKRGL
ncbi:UDP-2,4-diacetamido-2,4,6-trideoxy-beta-L-altropyranose hydrolase [Desulfosediminicola sp.]|uniref:UDP-2,4-diacetamido-2,4, 6-trideoxy-beta-L-altropyranose hydrolase n=1 Tax=Desulfosediminicola sp. TaxID=2886825 RepID=UPI003AF2F94A